MAPRLTDNQLLARLKQWRQRKAEQKGYDELYRICRNQALEDIAQQRPRTRTELLRARDIGATRANDYGQELLEIVREADGDDAHDVGMPRAPAEAALPLPRAHANTCWTMAEVSTAQRLHQQGEPIKVIAAQLGRSDYAVRIKLGLAKAPNDSLAGSKRGYDGGAGPTGPATPAKRMAR